MQLELQAVTTAFQADESARDAFASHLVGSQWMIFANTLNKKLRWDYVSKLFNLNLI